MDIEAYRRECLAEIAQSKARKRAGGLPSDVAASLGPDSASIDLTDYAEAMPVLLARFADENAGTPARLAALKALDAMTFNPSAFAGYRADWLQALRDAALDKDVAIRTAVLERLALEKDEYAQGLLTESLEKKRRAIVPTAKAVQLLGFDEHGPGRSVIREMAESGSSKVREEAVRALASDPSAADLLVRLATDKTESNALRKLSTVSLKEAAPDQFERVVRALVGDADDDDTVRATALSAAAHSARLSKSMATGDFAGLVDRISVDSPSRSLKASARRFNKAARI